MTAPITIRPVASPATKSPSRRALLAGALSGLGALAAGAIGRDSPVRAAAGDPVLVDGTHTGVGITQITTSGASGCPWGNSSHSGANAVWGRATALTGGAWGVVGESQSSDGVGVFGAAYAVSGTTYGVRARLRTHYIPSASPAGVGAVLATIPIVRRRECSIQSQEPFRLATARLSRTKRVERSARIPESVTPPPSWSGDLRAGHLTRPCGRQRG